MEPLVRHLGLVEYVPTWQAMQRFTSNRDGETRDEIWLCEHPPVYTQGLAGRAEHVLDPAGVPVVPTDRGGQVTYHGPGQVVAYALIDLRRLGIFVKEYVYRLEHCLIKTLEDYGVTGYRVSGAPGIYVRLDDPAAHGIAARKAEDGFVGLGKLAALGIKVSRHRTYHGVALNVAMDLRPFDRINPCGYPGLRTVDLATLGTSASWSETARSLGDRLALHLSS